MRAIVLAGGKGTRLAPYTTVLPKPLMPIGEMPILEIVIRQLQKHGFDNLTLAVGYLAELLMAYCGDGSKFGVKLDYSREEQPLGTAGPIALVPNLNVFNFDGYWLDIGRHDDYERAIEEFAAHRADFL